MRTLIRDSDHRLTADEIIALWIKRARDADSSERVFEVLDENEAFAFALPAVTWAGVDGLGAVVAAARATRWIMTTGSPADGTTSLPTQLRFLYTIEGGIALLTNGGVALVALVVSLLMVRTGDIDLWIVAVPGWLAAGLLTALAARLFLARTLPGPLQVILTALAIRLVVGEDWLVVIAAGVASGVLGHLARASVERRFEFGPVARRLPAGILLPSIRRTWAAANRAERQRNFRIAAYLMWKLGKSVGKSRPDLAAAAFARQASLLVAARDDRAAMDALSVAENLDTGGTSSIRSVLLVESAARDLDLGMAERALPKLLEARQRAPRRWPEYALSRLLLIRARADTGDIDGAAAELVGLGPAARYRGGIQTLVDTQVSLATAELDQGHVGQARGRVSAVLDWFTDKDDFGLFPSSLGRAHLLNAQVLLAEGDRRAALTAFDDAWVCLDPLGASLVLGEAGIRRGSLRIREGEARTGVDNIARAIAPLERRRGSLRQGALRSSSLSAARDLYSLALESCVEAQDRGEGSAGPVATVLVESTRRSAMAQLVRATSDALPDATRRLIEELERAEQDGGAVSDDLVRRVREALGETFARLYVPHDLNFEEIRTLVAGANVLSYFISPESGKAFVTWVSSGGESSVHAINLEDPWLAAVLADLGREVPESVVAEVALRTPINSVDARRIWLRVAQLLLPDALRRQLMAAPADQPERLIIVPDGPLSGLPWGALRLESGTLLIEAAIPQLTPSLDLVEWSQCDMGGSTVAYCDTSDPLPSSMEERRVLERSNALILGTTDEFFDRLNDPGVAVAYVSATGSGLDANQTMQMGGVDFRGSSALTRRWPGVVILAACMVARFEVATGAEPLGVAAGCLIGGAHSVIGGVLLVNERSTADLAPRVASLIGSGVAPAEALRSAQVNALAQSPLASVQDVLGMACVSRSLHAVPRSHE